MNDVLMAGLVDARSALLSHIIQMILGTAP